MSYSTKCDEIIEKTIILQEKLESKGLIISNEKAISIVMSIQKEEAYRDLNMTLRGAFAVSDNSPSGLEAIAMQLGYDRQLDTLTIPQALSLIGECLDNNNT